MTSSGALYMGKLGEKLSRCHQNFPEGASDAISVIAWDPDGTLLALGAKSRPAVCVICFEQGDSFFVDITPKVPFEAFLY